jgi:CBS domain-containing protein
MMVEGRIEGILTTRDVIQRVVARGLDPRGITVGEIATHPVIVLKPETFIGEAIKIMLQRRLKKTPLVNDGVVSWGSFRFQISSSFILSFSRLSGSGSS